MSDAALLRAFVDEPRRGRRPRRRRVPRLEIDAARAGAAGQRRRPRPGAARRTGGRLLRARHGEDVPAAGGRARDLRDGGDGARAGGGRGGVLARAARRPHGRPAGRAAGPRRAADHRPGPPVRPDGQVVRRAAALRRRSRDGRPRAFDRGPRRGDGGRRTGGTRAPQRPRSASRCCRTGRWGRRPTRSRRRRS